MAESSKVFRLALPFTLSVLMLTHQDAAANCELSWVSRFEDARNWFHTVAVHAKKPDPNVVIVQTSKARMTILCPTADPKSCPRVDTVIPPNGGACGARRRTITVPAPEWDTGRASEDYMTCVDRLPTDAIGILEGHRLRILAAEHLSAAAPRDDRLAKEATTLGGLGPAKVEYGLPPVDLKNRHFRFDQGFVDGNANHRLLLLRTTLSGRDFGQPETDTKVDYPIMVLDLKGRAPRLFATGATGSCVESDDTDPLSRLQQGFGLPARIRVYHRDADGTPDFLELAPRSHLPGERTLYRLTADRIEVLRGFCRPHEECAPEPGC